jgi:hypothetical protein
MMGYQPKPENWSKSIKNSTVEYLYEYAGFLRARLDLVRLNPTGRWKIYFDPKYNEILIEVEHKSRTFPYEKRWLRETEIVYRDLPPHLK